MCRIRVHKQKGFITNIRRDLPFVDVKQCDKMHGLQQEN